MKPNYKGSVGTLFLAFVSVVGSLAAEAACGESSASCDSVCALPGASSDCASDCAAEQSACASGAQAADFQAFLTCVVDVGTFPGGSTCASEAAAVESECGTASGGEISTSVSASGSLSESDAGVGPTSGSGVSTGTVTGVDVTRETDGGVGGGSTVVSVGTGDSTGSGTSTSACAVGAPCEGTTGCVLPSAGPCGGPAVLACGSDGQLTVAQLPCGPNEEGCGWGVVGGCSEECSCVDGQMVCAGDCPESGVVSP